VIAPTLSSRDPAIEKRALEKFHPYMLEKTEEFRVHLSEFILAERHKKYTELHISRPKARASQTHKIYTRSERHMELLR